MLTVPSPGVAGGGAEEAAELSCSRNFSPLDNQQRRRTKHTRIGTSECEKKNNNNKRQNIRALQRVPAGRTY